MTEMDRENRVPTLTPEGHAALRAHDAGFLVGQAVISGTPVTVTVDRLASPCVVTAVGLKADGGILAERRTVPLQGAISLRAIAEGKTESDAPAPTYIRAQDYVDRAFSVGKPVAMQPSEGLDWLGLRGGVPGFAEHYRNAFRIHNGGHPDAEALCEAAAAAHLLSAGTPALGESLDEQALDALACIGTFGHAAYEFYALAEGPRREARLQAAASYPLLAAEITAQPLVKFAIDSRKPLAEKLERAFGVDAEGRFYLTKPLLKRLQGLSQPDNGLPVDVLVRTLSQMPPDWFPRDDAEWDAFCDLTDVGFRDFAPKIGERPDKLCPGAAGKWAATRARIARSAASTFPPEDLDEAERKAWRPTGDESREGLKAAFTNAMDMVTAFRDLVVMPVAASGTRDDIPLSEKARFLGTEVAARILFGGKSLVAVMEAQRHWHTQVATVVAAREPMPGDDEIDISEEISVSRNGWPPLCDEWEAPNGVTIVPLTDPQTIREEGAALNHCVGTYSGKCRSGESHILSFRQYQMDGGFKRLSTAEFSTPPADSDVLVSRQHHGKGNGAAPQAAKDAFAWFVAEVAAGRIPLNRDKMMSYRARKGIAPDDVTQAAGYDRKNLVVVERCLKAWQDWMPKRLREMDIDAIRECPEMEALTEEVAPTYRYAAAL